MRVLAPEEGIPLPPSICFICEQAPLNGVIDTGRTHDPQVPTNLRGRKYLCVNCAEEFAKIIGYVPVDAVGEAEAVAGHALAEKAELQLRVEQLEAVHVETLKDLLAKATKPAPARRAVAKADGE